MQLREAWRGLMRLLTKTGLQQSGSGQGAVQARHVRGNLTVINVNNHEAQHEEHDDARPPPTLAELMHVYHRLRPVEKAGADRLIAGFHTTTMDDMTPGEKRRLAAYMRTCVANRGKAKPK